MNFHPYATEELLPTAWADLKGGELIRIFNPAIIEEGAGWAFAYRVVAGDGKRRIGICRLGPDFRPLPGSALPLSDRIGFAPGAELALQAREWFADPRLLRVDGQIHLYWNSGWHEQNSQFLQPLDGDLNPAGPARELVFPAGRRAMEKNWMVFGEDGRHAIYSPCPQRVLRLDWSHRSGPIVCLEAARTEWNTEEFAARFGELRGGAPPQRCGDSYYAICHSVAGVPGDYRYVPSVYRFSAAFPFAPLAGPQRPIELPNPHGGTRAHPKLNPAVGEVVYPCGAVRMGDQWVVSYGINDERAAIAVIEHAEIESSLITVSPSPEAVR